MIQECKQPGYFSLLQGFVMMGLRCASLGDSTSLRAVVSSRVPGLHCLPVVESCEYEISLQRNSVRFVFNTLLDLENCFP